MLIPVAWWVWRELLGRPAALIVGVLSVALPVALAVSVDRLARVGEAAIDAELDHLGPPWLIMPQGVSTIDVIRHEVGTSYLERATLQSAQQSHCNVIRAADPRLLTRLPAAGGSEPVYGIDPTRVVSPFDALGRLDHDEVAVGAEVALRLGLQAGDPVDVGEVERRVMAVLPHTGTHEDLLLFLPLAQLQELMGLADVVTEIRIYPYRHVPEDQVASRLQDLFPQASLIETGHGSEAEAQIVRGVRNRRWALLAAMSAVLTAFLVTAAYLNGRERHTELATVLAVGGTRTGVVMALVSRAALVATLGALTGLAGGIYLAALLGRASPAMVPSAGIPFPVLVAIAVAMSVCGVIPVGLSFARRDHVQILQR